jgi:hypothetical protein
VVGEASLEIGGMCSVQRTEKPSWRCSPPGRRGRHVRTKGRITRVAGVEQFFLLTPCRYA